MKRIIGVICITFFVVNIYAQKADYFQQDVDYKIDITLDPQTQKFSGTQRITYTNNSPDVLRFIWFHLYLNAFKNDETPFAKQMEAARSRDFYFSEEEDRGYLNLHSVMMDGEELNWQYKEDAIDEVKILLTKPLLSGETVTIEFIFDAKFPKVFSRSGHYEGRYFQGAQWYPKVVVYDKYGWHPDSYLEVGEFYGEFGSFDVRITLPQNFVIDATGVLADSPSEQEFNNKIIGETKKLLAIADEDGREKYWQKWRKRHRGKTDYSSLKTVRFKAENVHDFAWFAGEDYMIHQKTIENGIIVKILTLPQNVYDWRLTPDYVERTLQFYGERVGAYKYPKVTVVDGTHISFGGMEYPMITLITTNYSSWNNLLEMVIAHEVGHNWFQGMLGSNERASVFLDEGLNTYFDAGNMTHLYGEQSFAHFDSLLGRYNVIEDLSEWHYYVLQLGDRVSKGRMQPMSMRGEEYGRTNYSIVNYAKAVFMLNALKWTMGDQAFDRAIKVYFERWHFKHPELDDFWAIMQESSDQDLSHFRKQWMETTHYSDLEIQDYTTIKSGNNFTTEVFVTENGNLKGLPAPVYLITEEDDTLEGRWSGNNAESVMFEHTASVKRVEVNLKRLFFETNYLNNSSFPKVEFRFLDPIPGIDKYKVSFYPYLGYEYFKDGTRLGTGFFAGNWLQRHYLLNGNVYYGTNSSNIGYELAFSHRIPELLINYTNLFMSIQDKDGLKKISTAIQTYYSNPENFTFLFNTKFSLSHIKLYDMEYHEAGIYERQNYTTAKINFRARYRKMLWNMEANLSIEKTLDVLDSEADYIKAEFSEQNTFYFTKNIYTRVDMYSGFISGDDIPSQESIFAGGDVDPKHENFVIGYRGSVAPLRSQSLQSGMGMLGYSHYERIYLNNKAGFSAGAGIKLPYMPIIYGRVGALSDELSSLGDEKFFSEAGLKLDAANMAFIFPLWVSDPVGTGDNFDFRFYFSIETPLNFN